MRCKPSNSSWVVETKKGLNSFICHTKIPFKLKEQAVVRSTMLYEICCFVKNQHETKLRIAEMRMLSLMCGKTKHDMIKNKNIRVRVASIVEKTVELDYVVCHLDRKYVGLVVRIVYEMKNSRITNDREILKKIL